MVVQALDQGGLDRVLYQWLLISLFLRILKRMWR